MFTVESKNKDDYASRIQIVVQQCERKQNANGWNTLSRGSACSRNQPATACPASWYAQVVFSESCSTWVFFSRPEGKVDIRRLLTNAENHTWVWKNQILTEKISFEKDIAISIKPPVKLKDLINKQKVSMRHCILGNTVCWRSTLPACRDMLI